MNFERIKYSYDEIHTFVKKSNDLTNFALLKLNIRSLMIENLSACVLLNGGVPI